MFRVFFKNFDSDLFSLRIVAYGVSITTLEDVFMKVGHIAVGDGDSSAAHSGDLESHNEYPANLMSEESSSPAVSHSQSV
jgi:hypothetical protein